MLGRTILTDSQRTKTEMRAAGLSMLFDSSLSTGTPREARRPITSEDSRHCLGFNGPDTLFDSMWFRAKNIIRSDKS